MFKETVKIVLPLLCVATAYWVLLGGGETNSPTLLLRLLLEVTE